jgi:hypothetical protein
MRMERRAHKTLQPPLDYEIRVRGAIGPTMLQAFPALAVSRSGADTLLCGPLPDPAALYGLISQLEALGLELLEVRSGCSEPKADGS